MNDVFYSGICSLVKTRSGSQFSICRSPNSYQVNLIAIESVREDRSHVKQKYETFIHGATSRLPRWQF
ncbi:hypothetical protein ACYSNM_08680 [Myroides sp. LJL116]